MPQAAGWRGDPIWLADVLRAEGLDVAEFAGWQGRGHGDFKDIRGVMVHHTGSDFATAASIAYGRPDLPGPLSQVHIGRTGTVTVVAAGVAWHAGVGMYPWLPVRPLARYGYDSVEALASVNVPALFGHSEEDEIIPYALGLRLYEGYAGPKSFLPLAGDHNSGYLTMGDVYIQGLRRFLNGLEHD